MKRMLLLFLIMIMAGCKLSGKEGITMSEKAIKEKLTDLQYHVTRENGTEPPFNNEYWDNKKPGIYVDIITGEPLFSSLDKYKSGTGWPSFTSPIDKEALFEKNDLSLGMARSEVRSSSSDSHLGHVFTDGPEPTGLRYCVNSAALRFIPVEKLIEEGHGKYLMLFKDSKIVELETAVFGAGCFWGVEHLFKQLEGVIDTTVGYSGGFVENPDYIKVSTGKTGHAEAVLITYVPKMVSYETLLDYFFRLHDPTTLNKQGADRGTQYRSVIFYTNEDQQKQAVNFKKAFDADNVFNKASVTEIVKFENFYDAEDYHQDYFDNHGGYICHTLRKK